MQTYKVIRSFISCPDDVKREREMIEDVIKKIDDDIRKTLGITLEDSSWSSMDFDYADYPEKTIQQMINEQMEKCDLFILVLYKQYGRKEAGFSKSNTEREVDIILKLLRENKDIMFLPYFREIPDRVTIDRQETDVKKLRTKLAKKKIIFCTYKDLDDLKDKVTHDLYKTILRSSISSQKHRALRCFWRFGIPEVETHPRLAIIFPPISRSFMEDSDTASNFWHKRLVPNIVFEDFKALLKIDKSLRLIGFSDFKIYSTFSIPANINYMNRFWICLPRNERALRQLKRYEKRSKFEFTQRELKTEATIKWKDSSNSKIIIRSPLSNYLQIQRKGMGNGEFDFRKANIIAKDFAVVSRFNCDFDDINTIEGFLMDYFVAGIRGLGTWGAAWFIDRKYDIFLKFKRNQNIQLLLEVTYLDDRIIEVQDVSNESQSYFNKHNDIKEIKKIIKEYEKEAQFK